MKRLILLCVMMGCAQYEQESSEETERAVVVPPNLEPVATLGSWRCRAHYNNVPPFVVEHDAGATFEVTLDTGATWLRGEYHESGPGAFHITELWTRDDFGNGWRTLHDNRHGRLVASLELVTGGVRFLGTYSVGAGPGVVISVPYSELLLFGPGRTTFTAESSVSLPGPNGPESIVFQTLSCALVGGAS